MDIVVRTPEENRRLSDQLDAQLKKERIRNEAELKEFADDFLKALELIQQYQRALNMLGAPDPNVIHARNLLSKYKMEHLETSKLYQIFLDGRDITDYPEVSATATEMELEPGDQLELEPEDLPHPIEVQDRVFILKDTYGITQGSSGKVRELSGEVALVNWGEGDERWIPLICLTNNYDEVKRLGLDKC